MVTDVDDDRHRLGQLDKAGIETCNKVLRELRMHLARKVSQEQNLIGICN